MIGIYKITSPSGKIYIGQSWDIKKRLRGYKNTPRFCHNKFLKRSLLKYGSKAHSFEIMYVFPLDITQEVLDKYEYFYWEQYYSTGFKMFNSREPGSNGKHLNESKIKMSNIKKIFYSDPENKKRMKLSQSTPNAKLNNKLAAQQRWNDPIYHSISIEGQKKFWSNLENRKKRSESVSKAMMTPEARLRNSERAKKMWSDRKAKLLQIV